MLGDFLFEILYQWQWVILTLLPVSAWFYEKHDAYPLRTLAILLVFGDVLGMSLEHVLHSPIFYWHVSDLTGLDECFLVAWMSSLVLGFKWRPQVAGWLAILPLFLSIKVVEMQLLSLDEMFYAHLLGLGVGVALLWLQPRIIRLTYGIEQLFIHHASVLYPMALLVLFDINQNLIFFTSCFHFMFGYGGHQ